MNDVIGALDWLDAIARELMLFAGAGLLIGGLDDLLVDGGYIALRLIRPRRRLTLATLPPARALRFALFVPAWDEAAVIGSMLTTTLSRWGGADYRVFVGVYPNDPATRSVVEGLADERIRLIVNPRHGPTTKADNLNRLWRALAAEPDWRADAIIIHDAEDVVHAAALEVFAALLADHDLVQLPVLPIVAHGSRLLSGHYADEFAESHLKGLVVRTAIGAGLPLAGTECAILSARLENVAAGRNGDPFDADSLVEDYELGLRLAGDGVRGCFARIAERDGGPVVAVRAIFPGELNAAIRQKARWMTGIALAGWDRTGWSRPFSLGDAWMRLRDRRAPLAMLVLAAAYLALVATAAARAVHWTAGTSAPVYPEWMATLLHVNALLLCWRLLMRMVFTGRAYGMREAWWALPRFLVGNAVALLAAPRALLLYGRLLRGDPPRWDKTAHQFPQLGEAG